MAEIVLINPRFEVSYWGLEHALPFLNKKSILPTAALPLIAALTPAEHSVTIVDENVEAIDFDRCAKADVVGLTGMNVQRRRMREILEELKRRGAFVVVGGPWITVEEAYFDGLVDAIFIGEADETWPRFLADWSAGRPQRRYEQAEPTDMTRLPAPRLDLLKSAAYAHGSVQFSRGCPFTCEFCDIIVVFGRRPRLKTAGQVIKELEGLVAQGMRTAFVVDDNLVGNKKAVRQVVQEIVHWQQAHGYPLSFVTEASLDLADDPDLMDLMVEANFAAVFVGIETPSEASLKETKKLQNLRKGGTMIEKVHRIQDAGLEVWSGMIVGFDNDDPGIFEAQRRFIREARIITTMVNMLVAVPKTPLHARLKRDGRLDDVDFPPYGTNVIPLRLTREELSQGYLAVMRDLYDADAYFARVEALYLDGRLRTEPVRRRFIGPWRRFKDDLQRLLEAGVILGRLALGVGDARLRRKYLSGLWRFLKAGRDPDVLWVYAVKCVMHYHYHRMLARMSRADAAIVNNF
ncbi:MAG TPA: radical SAM protein [Stellaceae bacterium]|nr:radical SAM protein [Stellaceae bacterium]